MTETWRTIPGVDDRYEVSDLGNVRSYALRGRTDRRADAPRLLRPIVDGGKYLCVGIDDRLWKIHALVLTAFVGPRPPGAHACHTDGDKHNNRLSNLRWDSPEANERDKRHVAPDIRARMALLGSRPGPNIPEAQRRTVAVKLRLPPATAAHLDELVDDGGYTRSETVAAIIDAQWEEWQATKAPRGR